jgi:hypothetical protein
MQKTICFSKEGHALSRAGPRQIAALRMGFTTRAIIPK